MYLKLSSWCTSFFSARLLFRMRKELPCTFQKFIDGNSGDLTSSLNNNIGDFSCTGTVEQAGSSRATSVNTHSRAANFPYQLCRARYAAKRGCSSRALHPSWPHLLSLQNINTDSFDIRIASQLTPDAVTFPKLRAKRSSGMIIHHDQTSSCDQANAEEVIVSEA